MDRLRYPKGGAVPDRRRSHRFLVKEGVFVQLVSDCGKIGQVIDISLRGLSFRYVQDDQCISERGKLRIIISDSGLFLSDIPINTVSDIEIEGGFSISPLKLHRAGLKFTELSTEQKDQISRFIIEHTIGKQSEPGRL